MTDREMLELAAKAAGIYYWIDGDAIITHGEAPVSSIEWNPLHDDGDALRLAVKLGITIYTNIRTAYVFYGNQPINADEREISATEDLCGDPSAAIRRAIVRAAAEIGKGAAPFPSDDEIRENWT